MMCDALSRYLRYGHHEAIVSTVDAYGRPNFAPMGLSMGRDALIIRPYVDTRTYLNLRDLGEAVVMLSTDAMLYYYVLFNQGKLVQSPSKYVKPPRILGDVDLYIECVVNNITECCSNRAVVSLKPIYCEGGCGSGLAFSRANSMLIEALVHYTKLTPLINQGDVGGVLRCLQVIKYAQEVIDKLGSPELKEAVSSVVDAALRTLRGRGVQ